MQGKVGSTWKSLNSGPSANWVKDGIVSVIVQLGVKKSPDIPADVPLALDLARSPEDRQVLEVLCAPSATGYPSFMGPGVPRERVDAIRTAYAAALKDPEFIDAVIKGGLDIDPIGAEELTEVVRGIYALPRRPWSARASCCRRSEAGLLSRAPIRQFLDLDPIRLNQIKA